MIASVALFNILALVTFALPQKEVETSAAPQLLDDSDSTLDGTICPAEPKDLFDENYNTLNQSLQQSKLDNRSALLSSFLFSLIKLIFNTFIYYLLIS